MEISRITRDFPLRGSEPVSSESLFLAALNLYLIRLHEAVMQTWERFAEDLKVQAGRSKRANENERLRHYEESKERLEASYRARQ